MDFQYWLYIIIGVIYLLSQLRKKSEQKQGDSPDFNPERPQPRARQESSRPSTTQRQLTFEELLREITEGKTQAPPKSAPTTPSYGGYDYEEDEEDDDRYSQREVLENVDYDYRDQDKINQTYEQAKRQAFERPSLEETLRLGATDITFGKFKEFEEPKRNVVLVEYLAELKDPEGFKKAIVMSEILKPKF